MCCLLLSKITLAGIPTDLYDKAEKGDVASMLEIANIYESGDSTTNKDRKKAMLFFKKAADRGDVNAQYQYGVDLFYTDKPSKKTKDAAINYIKKSAVGGYYEAQHMLGILFLNLNSHELKKDNKVGMEWLERAAQQGNDESYYVLGLLYFKGYEDIKPDPVKAKFNLERSNMALDIGVLGEYYFKFHKDDKVLLKKAYFIFRNTSVDVEKNNKLAEQVALLLSQDELNDLDRITGLGISKDRLLDSIK